jgi:hypothetical protein
VNKTVISHSLERETLMRSPIKGFGARFGAAAAGAILIGAASAAPVFAHSQTVTPPEQDAVVQGPISQPYAQAHCNANSPSVVAEASNNVVVFTPSGALPCPTVANPGGQVHPHAD